MIKEEKQKLIEALKTLGLNEKEAKVYLASLELGKSGASDISVRAGLKRPNTYVLLDNLIASGFATKEQTKTIELFSVVAPEELLKLADKNQRMVATYMPELDKIYCSQPNRPIVQTFEGKAGLEKVYRMSGAGLEHGREVLYFGSMNHFLSGYSDLLGFWIEQMKDQKYRAREIIFRSEAKKTDYLKQLKVNNNPHHQVRFFSRSTEICPNDNMVFEDKLAIFSIGIEVFVTLIESKNIANAYRQYFELLWLSAKKIKF